MKNVMNRFGNKTILTLLIVLFTQAVALAQNTKVEINGNDVGSWFAQNWIWVTAVVVILFIILIFSATGSRRSKSKTTTYRNHDGKVVQTTTTETESDE